MVDAGTTDEEGREAFNRVLTEVGLRECPFAGVLLLSGRQADWGQDFARGGRATALTLPTRVKKIHQEIGKLLTVGTDPVGQLPS